MDFLRYAYTTSMRVDPDSEVVVPIKWFRAPVGAAIFPGHHAFGSQVWSLGKANSNVIGEVPGAGRVWSSGATPDHVDGHSLCGPVEAFLEGAPYLTEERLLFPNGIPVCCQSLSLLDDFLGPPGQDLSLHPMPVGPGWTVHRGFFTLAANAVFPDRESVLSVDNVFAGEQYASSDNGHSDVTLVVSFYSTGDFSSPGVVFRLSSGSDYWLLAFNPYDGKNYLFKRVGGAFAIAAAGTEVFSMTPGIYNYKVVLSGNDISCYFSDTFLFTISNSFNSTATSYGIREYSQGAPGSLQTVDFLDFTVTF